MSQDEQHLNLLSIFHYVVGGLTALFALFPLIHVLLGLMLVFAPQKLNGAEGPPPSIFGWFVVVIAGVIILIGETFAILILVTGRFLATRRRYTFCFIMACLECLLVPFGTILGVFTIVVLNRDSVKQLFGAAQTPAY